MLIVPGRPTRTGLTWWVGSDGSGLPAFEMTGPTGTIGQHRSYAFANDVFVVGTRGLAPDSTYTLRARAPSGDTDVATTRTLPAAAQGPFTFMVGSCYSQSEDLGLLQATYPPSNFHPAVDPIRLRFLVGDQIYMDLSPRDGQPVFGRPDPAARYRDQWQKPNFASFLSRTPTLCVADDHEYWNDYPHGNLWLPWADPAVAGPFRDAFDMFQAALNLDPNELFAPGLDATAIRSILYWRGRTFRLDDLPLSTFVLDTRTARQRFDANAPVFCERQWLAAAVAWLQGLTAPGILVLGQPFIEQKAGWWARTSHTMGDVNLPDYEDDYSQLCNALFAAPHDVLVVTGDIHWSRLYQCQSPRSPNRRIFELSSSPLARIPQDNGSGAIDERTGKIEWKDSSANWTRIFARNAPMMYATVSLRSESPGAFRTDISIWGAQAKSDINLSRLVGATIILR